MTNRVIHQEYLEAWLRGESVQRSYKGGDWMIFDGVRLSLDTFDHEGYEFRITPKTVEVHLTDFYTEYDKISSMEISYERGYDKLVTLIKKYLPRY